MRLLLDTHALLWWLTNDRQLSKPAHDAIANPNSDVHVSAVTALEIAIKHRIGKLPQASRLIAEFADRMRDEGFNALSVTVEHGLRAGNLPIDLRDPFDRILIAQSLVESMALVSNERAFDPAGLKRLW